MAYLEPSQKSKMELFTKTVNSFQWLTILEKKLQLRCSTSFWMRLCSPLVLFQKTATKRCSKKFPSEKLRKIMRKILATVPSFNNFAGLQLPPSIKRSASHSFPLNFAEFFIYNPQNKEICGIFKVDLQANRLYFVKKHSVAAVFLLIF